MPSLRNISKRLLHTDFHQGQPFGLLRDAEIEPAIALARQLAPGAPMPGALHQALLGQPAPTWQDLFFLNGEPLPCYLPEDNTPDDPWLTADNYYPLYFRLYQHLRPASPARPTLLEVGVRTGYAAVVWAHAMQGHACYMGIDPGLYLPQGMALAKASLDQLYSVYPQFQHQLVVGYSTGSLFFETLALNGPYTFIHIDGDHSIRGKVIDLWVAKQLVAPGGYVLLDDFNHAPSVQRAVAAALKLGWFKEMELVGTLRGLAVLR